MNLCTYQTTNRNGTIGERKIVPLSEAEVKSFLLLINVTPYFHVIFSPKYFWQNKSLIDMNSVKINLSCPVKGFLS